MLHTLPQPSTAAPQPARSFATRVATSVSGDPAPTRVSRRWPPSAAKG